MMASPNPEFVNETETAPPADPLPDKAALRLHLGAWNYYFLIKIVLFWRELIGFHPIENLAFAAFLLAPANSPAWRRIKAWLALVVGAALLYYDSWLPAASRVFSQTQLLSNFSFAYMLELMGRMINWQLIALLVLGWFVYRLAAYYLRVGVLTLAGLLALSLSSGRQVLLQDGASAGRPATASATLSKEKSLDILLQEFYAKEALRSVRFQPAADGAPAFDVIFLHICSLSWDDLQATGLDVHPLWQRFDFVFHHFNSATSYSGPAAIRIHRAPCGQSPNKGLYSATTQQCYLMPSLKQAGFEPNLAFNHDGHFDDFLSLVRAQGVSAELMPLNGIAMPQRSFDDSPVYDDAAVLGRWLDKRNKSSTPRVALYYNTISLHDGNRILNGAGAGKSSSATYKARLEKLLTELDDFMRQLERSGRRAVVVLLPEHGAALRGDKMQISGLRDIATPAITTVPVGIKVIGPDTHRQGEAAHVNDATSYTAVSHIIARMLAESPFGGAGFSADNYLNNLPTTDYLAETDNGIMMQRAGKYFLRQDKEDWKPYDAQQR